MKRSSGLSSSGSEFDGEESDCTDTRSVKTEGGSQSPATFSHDLARKKRRGVVEKRRRDRINNSLSELRRLVPSACEKQGSTKLEKAEILQMTVDHLKILHTSGGKGYFETQAFATDYRILGYRECLSEVAKYLSLAEGLGCSDPLKARLMSHLNTCASQREVVTVEMGLQPWSALYPHQPVWTAHSHFCAELLTRRFPLPAEQSHHTGSPPNGVHLEQSKKVTPTGALVPVVTSCTHLSPSVFPISSLSAIQFPFSIGPLPLLPAPALCPPASAQAAKIAKHLWSTEVGAF
uniref:Hairy/enhancer-of-split related with YRPW motif protein 1-like n=1 Tax=Callorhinchus milii TaxID=7868 RepID=A0A4W3GWH8_CALMI|eukprot:gi/632989616/ref/XP_007883743.1/ PREDICTED: hairy/enhancer-of-split related with YRPW motif protein 1-like [Callorhinchus milii]